MKRFVIQMSVNFVLSAALLFASSCDDSGDSSAARCGNNVVEEGEECDGEDLGRYKACDALGFSGGTLLCTDQCSYDTSWCNSYCGDGQVQYDKGEECDGDNLDGRTCLNMGLGSGILHCTDECLLDTSGCEIAHVCGNGRLEDGEQCDGGDSRFGTCEALGFHQGGSLTCTQDCIIDYSGCWGETDDDPDNDGVPTPVDNCPDTYNEPPESYGPQRDRDDDGVGDECDNCPDIPNTNQVDSDHDGQGDACTGVGEDSDGDGVYDAADNCPYTYNPSQSAIHEDGIGDLCLYSSVTTGAGFTCAVTLDRGRVVCWGRNDSGQLGNVSTSGSLFPVVVMTEDAGSGDLVPLQNISQISAGREHVCAVSFDGQVYCWGSNMDGQLGSGMGSGDHSSYALPVMTSTSGILENVMSVSAGDAHTCAVLTDMANSTVWCWGNNEFGQLGNGSTDGSMEAVQVKTDFSGNTLSGIVQISSGQGHTCALHEDGHTVYCWGDNSASQCGVDSHQAPSFNVATQVPRQADSGSTVSLSAGANFTCVSVISTDDGTGIWCWGGNTLSQLGCGSCPGVTMSATPVRVMTENGSFLSGVSAFDTGFSHSCAIDANNVVMCWGGNSAGQLGIDTSVTYSDTAVHVNADGGAGGTAFSALGGRVSAGFDHTCATRPVPGNGAYGMEIWCWGDNSFGQLGTGNNESNYVPVPVADVAARATGLK